MLDIEANRRSIKYSRNELMLRCLWGLVHPLFRFSPRICFGWRRFLLRLFGARIGKAVHIYNTAMIYMPWNLSIGDWSAIGEWALIYNLGPVTVGSRVTISHGAHLCAGTHDHTDPTLPLMKPPISIADQVWICTQAYVGPGMQIGEGAVVGARAVVVKDVDPWTIVVGNPARVVGKRMLKNADSSITMRCSHGKPAGPIA